MGRRVCVAMSGGVDSSVAAAMMVDKGYDVCGITMRMHESLPDDAERGGTDTNVSDAKIVAKQLGIEHHVVDVGDRFKLQVVDYFVKEYATGHTPNPCVRCNQFIKFGFLMEKARKLGYQYLATGHYAIMDNGVLRKGMDGRKDQSYFLYVTYAAEPKWVLFPLGWTQKTDTRDLAAKFGLHTASRKESQDICFIPDNDYGRYLSNVIPSEPGAIVSAEGKQLGTHKGLYRYTVGQRKGLGSLGEKLFVKEIRTATNTVVVAKDEELMSRELTVRDIVAGQTPIKEGVEYSVKIRYRTCSTTAVVREYANGRLRLLFLSPVRAVAPGQSAVLYHGDTVIGGGVIEESVR